MVKPSRKIGRARMYKINREHPLVKRLDEMINEISLQIAEQEAHKAQAMHVSKK